MQNSTSEGIKIDEKSMLGRPRGDIFGSWGRFLEVRKIYDFLMVVTAAKNRQKFVVGAPRGRKVGFEGSAARENWLRPSCGVPAEGPRGSLLMDYNSIGLFEGHWITHAIGQGPGELCKLRILCKQWHTFAAKYL